MLPARAWASVFGEELGPLLELVAGQVQEIDRLAQGVGVAKDQIEFLKNLNDGINKTVNQIRSLQEIMERVQNLDPRSVKSLAELNDMLDHAKTTQGMVEDLLGVKIQLADQAIERTALQSENAYLMGQEMVSTGSALATESRTASPGRAAQITAASSSAQMLSQGVQLQTLAQVAELQALLLEFQKQTLQRDLQSQLSRRQNLLSHLALKRGSKTGKSPL
jgi:NADH dehydrogenase/NADH:ubiquinone oxidoreductase subunit G